MEDFVLSRMTLKRAEIAYLQIGLYLYLPEDKVLGDVTNKVCSLNSCNSF